MMVGCGGGALHTLPQVGFLVGGWCEWLIECDCYCGGAIRANRGWTRPQGKTNSTLGPKENMSMWLCNHEMWLLYCKVLLATKACAPLSPMIIFRY